MNPQSIFSNEDNPPCPSEQMISERCEYNMQRPDLSGSDSFCFTNTDFLRCSTDGNGGAILLEDPEDSTLTVSCCTFSSCTCTTSGSDDGTGGGAIYASGVSQVLISSSFFLSCSCSSTYGCDGGAVELWNILSQPFATNCVFVLCHADDDGGGLSVWNSKALNRVVCKDSSFLHCDCGDGGGGFILWENFDILQGYNLLFSSNDAETGGAYVFDCSRGTPDYSLCFCFFNRNTAAHHGTDAAFAYFSPDTQKALLMHCFSTSDSHRIGYCDDYDWYTTDVDWISQDIITYIK